MKFTIPTKTTNPNNGASGHTRLASIIRSNERKQQRQSARLCTQAQFGPRTPVLPATVVVRRVAPSNGLDPHDGLGASLKGIIDGIADAMGLKTDRDPRVTWVLEQRRGAKGEYAVEVEIR